MADDRVLGSVILIGSLLGIVIYFWLLFMSSWSWLTIQVSAFLAVAMILLIVAWIGYTLATTPPPMPLEDFDFNSELEDSEKKVTFRINKETQPIEEVVEDNTVHEDIQDTPRERLEFKDRKSHIIHLCKESKYNLKTIVTIIDDAWGYSTKNKSSKTRVSKTIRELKDNDLVRINGNGVIEWRGN